MMIYTIAMNERLGPSAGVVAAGIVAIAGSACVLLSTLLALVGLFVLPHVVEAPPPPVMPFFIRSIAMVMTIVFLAVAAFGIFTGVGLIRLRNWARIATLVWSGIAAPMSALPLVFLLLVPLPMPPNLPANLLAFTRVFAVLLYGAPLAASVWWLIFFTRKGVVSQFQMASSVPAKPEVATLPPAQVAPAYPGVPLPITVLACFLLLSSLSLVLIPFMPFPTVLFGVLIKGTPAVILDITWCVLYGVAGIGLLKRAPWSLSLALGLQVFVFLSGVVTLLSPNYEAITQQMMTSLEVSVDAYATPRMAMVREFAWAGLAVPVAILIVLLYYRSRFLEACAAKSRLSGTPNPIA
jgi:hypothetical protein